MRPRTKVEAVILHIEQDQNGEYIPLRLEVNSWVTLMPGKKGGHAKDANKHGGNSVEGAYKAQILKFRVQPGSKVISDVLVRHAYMYRQLQLDPIVPIAMSGCNYLYPSNYTDWINIKSITGVVSVVHAEIGEPTRGSRTHKELLHDSIFYYNAEYFPRVGQEQFGRLQAIPLPSLNDSVWPLPDMSTTEAFRARFRVDFLASMKPSTGSRATHLQWFVPFHVFVDLFWVASSIHKTATLFVFKDVTYDLMSSLMDDGWDSKITWADDIIKCTVDRSSIVFRFHIARSTLYTNFQFNRERRVSRTEWKPIDQVGETEVMKIQYEFGQHEGEIEVAKDWFLSNVRSELVFDLGSDAPKDFALWIIEAGHPPQKVNKRNEKSLLAGDIQPPRRIQIVERTN